MEEAERLFGEELERRKREGMTGTVRAAAELEAGRVIKSEVSSAPAPVRLPDFDEKNRHQD